MLGSRAVCLLRNVPRSFTAKKCQTNLQQVRFSSEDKWIYRGLPNPPKWATRSATVCACICYWWLGWNLWHQWGHVIGIYDGDFLKDPRTYTDEELGIPPDDE